MDGDAWARLESVFFRALELPDREREAFLDSACGTDAAFRREVEAVLAGHVAAGGTRDADRLLSPPAIESSGGLPRSTRVGAYELDTLVGRGGMGEVYRAHRADSQYEQQVAIKIVRAGRDTAELMRRFRTERQILARLQHPNIATLLDGGVTESGQPFLVMQYVDGVPITTYANERALDLTARLRLFVTVCEAVQFAHANLVVHRDLKPSNILVTDGGEVRLLDFGIAKLLGGAADEMTVDLLLTPEHAAPEQFLGSPVTTATDVYALGVLLHELLTGFRPFQFVPPLELPRAVCERTPSPPSVALRERRSGVSASRVGTRVDPRQLAGDVDCIVLEALRKEPERRYPSAAEMAADVRRYLGGFPVVARRETFGYVASRFLRRHRASVAASAALVVALVALAVVSVRSAISSRAQAAEIARERDVALQVSGFLEDLFKSPDPFATGPTRRDTLRVKDFLDEGVQKVERDLTSQPLVQARLLSVLGLAHSNLGALAAAGPPLQRALAIRRRELGPRDSATASTEQSLGIVLWQQGKPAVAESLFRSAAATFARDSIGMRAQRTKALGALGNSLQSQGRFSEAEAAYREALALATAHYKPIESELAGRISDLGTVLSAQAKYVEAESLFRRAIEIERAAAGPDHPRMATPMGNLAVMFANQERFAEADSFMRGALAIQQARLPSPHPRTASTIGSLATIRLQRGRPTEADSLLREAIAMMRQLYGARHPMMAGQMLNLAAAVEAQGKWIEALEIKREALTMVSATVGPEHPTAAMAHNNIGYTLHLHGRHGEAVESFRSALTIRRKKLGDTHPLTANSLAKLGQCLADLGRHEDALRHFEEAFTVLEPLRKRERHQWDALLEQMARSYGALGRTSDSTRYQAMRTSVVK